jgi:hypothetical protein
MNREVHVRFWESPEVKVLRATRQHLDGFAAENNRRSATPPMRGHDNDVAPSRFNRIDNRLVRLLVLNLHYVARHTRGRCGILCYAKIFRCKGRNVFWVFRESSG